MGIRRIQKARPVSDARPTCEEGREEKRREEGKRRKKKRGEGVREKERGKEGERETIAQCCQNMQQIH